MVHSPTTPDLPIDLPPVADGWECAPLGGLIDESRGICYGIVQPGSPQEDGIPILRVGNIRQGRISTDHVLRVSPEVEAKYSRSRLRGGEVLLTLVGSLGESAVVPEELAGWNVARAVAVIPVIEDVGARWVELCLRSATIQHYIRIWATTTVQATLNLRDLARLPIPLPGPKERKAISCILGALDDKIELNGLMNQTLEEMARTIFKSWFVDFDPVRAKAAGQQPPGLASQIADLFPDAFQESELGEIPTGWQVGTLGTIANEVRDTVQASEIKRGTPYIALQHMPRHSIALASWDLADGIASAKLRFKAGDLLFGKLRPYFHKVGPAPLDGICSTDIVVSRPLKELWYGLALGHMSSGAFVDYTYSGSTGTKMPRTSWRYMSAFRIALPQTPVAAAFSAIVRPMISRIWHCIFEQRNLAAVRDTLLPKLISGESRVPDAEQIVARCT